MMSRHKESLWMVMDAMMLCIFATIWFLVVLGMIKYGVYELAWQPYAETTKATSHSISTDALYWSCISKHVYHHPAQDGMLTRFGRMSGTPAWDEISCDEWSATADKRPGYCPERNVWCQGNQSEKTPK